MNFLKSTLKEKKNYTIPITKKIDCNEKLLVFNKY